MRRRQQEDATRSSNPTELAPSTPRGSSVGVSYCARAATAASREASPVRPHICTQCNRGRLAISGACFAPSRPRDRPIWISASPTACTYMPPDKQAQRSVKGLATAAPSSLQQSDPDCTLYTRIYTRRVAARKETRKLTARGTVVSGQDVHATARCSGNRVISEKIKERCVTWY